MNVSVSVNVNGSIITLAILVACSGGDTSLKDLPDHGKDLKTIDVKWKDCPGCDLAGNDASEMPSLDGLATCSSNDDCESGYCEPMPQGIRVCAPLCGGGICPDGWECKPKSGPGGGTILVCQLQAALPPPSGLLCRPCTTDSECQATGGKSDDRCVDLGAEGRFCGRDCSGDGVCPSGYSCQDIPAGSGGYGGGGPSAARQCLPESGLCACTPEFIAGAFQTTCFVENVLGKCHGERHCAEGGLTACTAKSPVHEVCNGQDDDCDGTTDVIQSDDCQKQFGSLVCKGPMVCEGGVPVCKATDPGPELCDGIDNDCDGVTDNEDSLNCAYFYADADGDSYGAAADKKCLCKAGTPYTVLIGGDCDDGNAALHPGVAEICDGIDQDCNGLTDDGDPVMMCGGGNLACIKGTCGIAECKDGWFDVNGKPQDGCECQADASDDSSNTCGTALDLGEVPDLGVVKTVSGRIVPDQDEDWYRFKAVDTPDGGTWANPGHDAFSVRIRILSPADGSIGLAVYRLGCGQPEPCAAAAVTDYQWYTDFQDMDGEGAGESPCITANSKWQCCEPGQCEDGFFAVADECCNNQKQCVTYCKDDSAGFWFKVYRVQGKAQECEDGDYQVEVSNG